MNRFASKFAASTLVIAAAMVGCHSDSIVGSASASTEQRAHQQAERLAEQARSALQQGNASRALTLAERAVEASPQDVGYRMLLADLYLRNGRFQSAEASYDDVLSLDTANVRAGVSIALTQIAQGRNGDALVQLEQMRDSGPASDVGLAFALAGQPQRAIELLEPAARAAGANGRTRQNLALAYALSGDWQRARAVAAQDVSPAELGRRLQHWASLAQPSGQQSAVANLLGVTPAEDPGRPVRLALQLPADVAEAYAEAAPAEDEAPTAEAPAAAPVRFAAAAAPQPEPVAAAPVEEPIQYAEVPVVTEQAPVQVAAVAAAAPAPVVQQPVQSASWWPAPAGAPAAPSAPASEPVRVAGVDLSVPVAAPAPAPAAEEAPVRYAAALRSLSAPSPVLTRSPETVARTARPVFRPAPITRAAAVSARIPRVASGAGRFVVQLGAFANAANAERAWSQASRRFGFAASEARTARVTVNGREVTRVSVAGFASRADAVRVCSSIQARGGSCFVRAAAGDAPVRWASQGRGNGRA
ncbi:MAG TPA: SPOR domain-containing protein [Allosphingosinicella sp.]